MLWQACQVIPVHQEAQDKPKPLDRNPGRWKTLKHLGSLLAFVSLHHEVHANKTLFEVRPVAPNNREAIGRQNLWLQKALVGLKTHAIETPFEVCPVAPKGQEVIGRQDARFQKALMEVKAHASKTPFEVSLVVPNGQKAMVHQDARLLRTLKEALIIGIATPCNLRLQTVLRDITTQKAQDDRSPLEVTKGALQLVTVHLID